MTDFYKADDQGDQADERLFSPSSARNRTPIFEVLEKFLPASDAAAAGTVLEIASGSGEHAADFSPRLPHLTWQPSDIDAAALASIEAWRIHTGAANLNRPISLDVTTIGAGLPPGLGGNLCAVVSCNMIHIAPWACCEGLMTLAGAALPAGGVLFLYGPFMREGHLAAAGNIEFDTSLRLQNPNWGVRELADVVACAAAQELDLAEVIEMPANNLSLVFSRRA